MAAANPPIPEFPPIPDPELLTAEPTASAGAQAKPGVGGKEVASVHQGDWRELGGVPCWHQQLEWVRCIAGIQMPLVLVTKGQFGDEQVIAQILPSIHLC